MNRNKLISILLTSLISFSIHAQIVDTIFGKIDEQNPVAIKLLNHDVVQRLKHIDQSGPLIYISNEYPAYSRYDHSLGVYALLKRYNVSTEEQIAGLMHDTSHTVFSHLADYILF
jgi:HD superfamily phosphohydrolase